MKILNKNEMMSITGGTINITTTAINAIVKLVNTIFNIGRAVGSTIRRIYSSNTCPI